MGEAVHPSHPFSAGQDLVHLVPVADFCGEPRDGGRVPAPRPQDQVIAVGKRILSHRLVQAFHVHGARELPPGLVLGHELQSGHRRVGFQPALQRRAFLRGEPVLQVHHHFLAVLQPFQHPADVVGGDQEHAQHGKARGHGEDGGEGQAAVTVQAAAALAHQVAHGAEFHFSVPPAADPPSPR